MEFILITEVNNPDIADTLNGENNPGTVKY